MRTLVAALALLVLALALRLPHGELAEWKGDEAIQYWHARQIVREGQLPARGLPTTNGPRGSIHYLYALAPPLLVADDPEAIRVWVALLSSAAIVAAFLIARREVGTRPALAWALLLATLPGEVRCGRAAWHPNLVPIIATLVTAALLRARRSSAWAGALLGGATLGPLIHYSLAGVGAFALVAGLALAKTRRARLAGAALALVVLAPHVVIESRSGFQATRDALSVAGHKADDPERSPLAFPRLAVDAFSLERFARAANVEPIGFEPLASLLVKGLVLVGVLLAARGLARRKLEPVGLALLLALAAWAPFLALGLPARPHYAEAAVPPLSLLAAFALTRVPRAGVLLAPIGWAGVLSVATVLAAVDKGLVGDGSEYDLPIREKRAACRELLDRGLELAHFPRLEYVILLEASWRELPEDGRRRFELVPAPIPGAEFWDLALHLPRPRERKGRAGIFVAGTRAVVVELP
jgi:hypothetical protein